jgi:cytochrome P450
MESPMQIRRRLLAAMRETTPIHRDEPSKTFLLTRYADVRALLADNSLWRDADRAEPGAMVHTYKPKDMNRPGDRDCAMGWLDPPDHARVRGPIQLALARRVARLGPTVEAIVTERLQAVAGRVTFDLAQDVAMPIPIAVIGAVLGVETDRTAQFRAWSEAAIDIFNPSQTPEAKAATKAASEAISDYLDAAMDERRRAPRDDLMGDLIAAQDAGQPISDAEIRVNAMNLLLGGNVTTADLITSAAWLLLTHPAELAKLRADPALAAAAVEETLRVAPPTLGAQRIASGPMTWHGCPVAQGQVVAVMIDAANRDPAAFQEPDRFDITRPDLSHVSFGGGAHICIGAALARLQAKTAIAALFERFPALALADPDAPPAWRPAANFSGLDSLPVRTG